MIDRIYIQKLRYLLDNFPVVAVLGARQVGKTTLCRSLLKEERRYFNLDDITTLNMARHNPEALLDVDENIIIDEIQRAPDLLLEIKKRVDNNKHSGKYLLTGSANIELMPKLQETLAGRIVFLEMFPVTLFERYSKMEKPGIIKLLEGGSIPEICSGSLKRLNLLEDTLLGTYPEPMLRHESIYSADWYDGYIKTYLERDVRTLSDIHSLGDYQRVLSLASFRIGSLLSLTALANDCGLNLMTLKRYLNLLLISYQYYELRPFYRNIGKRLVKSPKLYSYDGGLSAHLLGITDIIDVERLNRGGALFENRIIMEIKTLLSTFLPKSKISFYNSHGGGEIDLIIELPGRLIPVEIKLSSKLKKIDTRTIENFMSTFSEAEYAIIVSQADQFFEIKKNIFIIPYQYLLM